MINLFTYLLRQLFATIDGLIYWAGAELYDLMIAIAEAKVFEDTTILTVAGRVYQLLGLIMLFKMIFSFLMYVINPDELMDKKKGVGNIIKRIIITLVLIVITPWAFEQSRNLQIYVIDDKVIEYFVFGQSKPSNASAGYNLMYITGKSFVAPYRCKDEKCVDTEQDSVVCGSDWDEQLPDINKDGTIPTDGLYLGKCAYGAGSNKDFAKDLYAATTLDENGHYDLRALMRIGAATEDDFLEALNGARAFAEYQILWSTLVGIFICYMLLVMCIDMAVRSVKLAFYEIIAPIPIVSYVGFKEGKDSMLNKWFSQCLKTYADLFTRIAGLQIAVFFIDEIADTGFAKNDLFVNIFLILGALTFAKELPKILEGMGVKFGGGGGFNLKKKFTDNMAGSRFLQRSANMGMGMVGGLGANLAHRVQNTGKGISRGGRAIKDMVGGRGFANAMKDNTRIGQRFSRIGSAYRDSRASGKGLVRSAWSAGKENAQFNRDTSSDRGGSLIGGAISGARAASKGDKFSLNSGVSGMRAARDARNERDSAYESGATTFGRTVSSVQQSIGATTLAQRYDKAFESRKNLKNQVDAIDKEMDSFGRKNNVDVRGASLSGYSSGISGLSEGYAEIMSKIDAAKQSGARSISVRDAATGRMQSIKAHEFEKLSKDMQAYAFDQIAAGSAVQSGTGAALGQDVKINAMITALDNSTSTAQRNDGTGYNYSTYTTTSYSSRVSGVKDANNQTILDQGSDKYKTAKANDVTAKPKNNSGKK